MEPILILHGWGWPIEAPKWQKAKELLEKNGYKVFLPDLPGFGSSPPPLKPWNINDYVEWVNDFCEKNNLSRFFLLGHSFGGSIAVKFSIKYPGKVKNLILIDSAGIRGKRLKKEAEKRVAHLFSRLSFMPFYKNVRRFAYKTFFKASDYFHVEGVMKETFLNVVKEDISAIFSQIKVPTLLIWGIKDQVTPLQHAHFIKEAISGAKLEIIPKVGHCPFRDAPELFVEKVLEYINI